VVGDQSSGKSSLLESLTKIPFPRDLELCTRYATQITSRRDSEPSVDIAIIPGPNASERHRELLADYHRRMLSTDDFRSQFPGILKEVGTFPMNPGCDQSHFLTYSSQVNQRMGIRTDTSSSEGTVFSEDVLKIEICGPSEDYLTVIDVPGIFRNPTEGITTKEDIKLVQNMVRKYVRDSRTIILAVLPSNVDIATQEILTLAKDYDPAGERTLGVLTKPDLVSEHSAQVSLCNLVLGKKQPLTLGYCVVRNRGADDDNAFDHDGREEMFRKEPWSGLPEERVGVQALKVRLGELLGLITRREFPGLRKDVNKQLTDCQRELDGLGLARQTEQQQRLFLSAMSREFERVLQGSLNAQYYSHSLFDEKQELKLMTHVVNLTEQFRCDFEERAQLRYFQDPGSSPSQNDSKKPVNDALGDPSDNEQGNQEANENEDEEREFVEEEEPDDHVLDNIISKDYNFDFPEDGIMDWIEALYLGSRGVELGTFGEALLSSAFKEQSRKWTGMTEAYMSRVIMAIHRFMTIALKELCMDVGVREEIWASILDEVLKRYTAAMDQARFLVSIERDKRPYTLNHYFNENLQHARGNRMTEMLKGKFWKVRKSTPDEWGHSESIPVIDFDSVKNATTSKSNVEHVKDEIHDILCSYYKVARKRFVDNVYHQAVDHFLLTGPMSPLTVFSQEWVIGLEVEQLDGIAGESPITKERRTTLAKKIHDLEVALRILRY
jgi:GTPase SAR1 family protein